MATNFLQEKKKQEVLIYVMVFAIIFTALYHFVGINFDFKKPGVVLEERDDFHKIGATLEHIKSTHDLDNFRAFTPILPFDGVPGRSNLFSIDNIETVEEPFEVEEESLDKELPQIEEENELPGEVTEEVVEEIIE